MEKRFPKLPSLNQILESPQIKKAMTTLNHNFVVDRVRSFLDDFRHQVATTTDEIIIPSAADLAERISNWLKTSDDQELRPVINATGYILHDGLGCVPLAKSVCNAVRDIAYGYSDLESVQQNFPSITVSSVEKLICELTSGEAALVVNNDATATLLTLAAISNRKEIIISRGELGEIAKGFRVSDVIGLAGAKLREVGAINRTISSDYEQAIHVETGAILKIHPSQFQLIGTTESVTAQQLASISRQHHVPLVEVVASTGLIDFSRFGFEEQHNVRERIQHGSDVVIFRGDKLLGGPNCGIIVGREKLIAKIKSHFLLEAVRADKMTITALTETLRLYRNEETVEQEVPLLRMLSMPIDNLKLRASKISQLIGHLEGMGTCEVVEDASVLDKDRLPEQTIRTWCVSVIPSSGSANQLAERLRKCVPSVIARVRNEQLLLDLRTIFPEQDQMVVAAFEEVMVSS